MAGSEKHSQNESKNGQKNCHFAPFFRFSQKIFTVCMNFYEGFLDHINTLYVQFHQNSMTGIRASKKEKS